jgi:hypothetical protein
VEQSTPLAFGMLLEIVILSGVPASHREAGKESKDRMSACVRSKLRKAFFRGS